MSFKKLKTCDASDMAIWASSPAAAEFMSEVMVARDAALRALIKSPSEEKAAIVRAYDRVACLMEEASCLK